MEYMINATATWLLSLVAYHFLLHGRATYVFSRSFLLLTLIAGIILPAIPLHTHTIAYILPVSSPISIATGGQPITGTTHASPLTDISANPIAIIWVAGTVIMLAYVLRDIRKIFRYYRQANQYLHNEWTVIETGKQHPPFSWGSYLFIAARSAYTHEEWHMILAHEAKHRTLMHRTDVLLLTSLRILLWFHPLVHIYYHQLRTVHELQADELDGIDTKRYAHFLVEQSLLMAAPYTGHSLAGAPLATRLRMLGRRPAGSALLTRTVLLLVLSVSAGCFSGSHTEVEHTADIAQPSVAEKAWIEARIQFLERNQQRLSRWFIDGLAPLLEQLEDGAYQIGTPTMYIGRDGHLIPNTLMQIRPVNGPAAADSDGNIPVTGSIARALQLSINSTTTQLITEAPALEIMYDNDTAKPYELKGLFFEIRNHKLITSL